MNTFYMKLAKKYFLVFLFFHICLIGGATNYYVSNSGNDSNTGLAPDKAWKTLTKVNNYNFLAGDSVLFKCGDIWLNQINLYPHGGMSGNPVVYASYGTGNKPVIRQHPEVTGWNISSNWTQSGNAWYMTFNSKINRLWINGNEVLSSQTSSVTQANKFYSNASVLYVYSVSNPATTFSSMTWPGGGYALYGLNKHNISFANIDFQGGQTCVRMKGCDNWTFDKCNIGLDCGGNGIGANAEIGVHETCDNNIIKNCDFITGCSGTWGWEAKYTSDGIQLNYGCNGWNIYNNRFEDWGHNSISITNSTTTYTVSRNKIHNNYCTAQNIDYGRGFGYSSVNPNESGIECFNNTFYDLGSMNEINGPNLRYYYNITNKIRTVPYRTTTARGLDFDSYSGGIVTGNEIYNNIFANCDDQGIKFGWDTSSSRHDNKIINNIFYNCDKTYNYAIMVAATTSNSNNVWKNNLVYKDGFTNIISYKGKTCTASEFNVLNGTDGNTISGNIYSDPLFVDPAHNDFHLRSGSPAINAGISVGLTKDISGNSLSDSKPDIGVYEYKVLTITSTEYKSICQGSNYNGWTTTGTYTRTLKAKSGADSIVTTVLTVNPTYTINEAITIQSGENYNGWTKTGTYSRKLSSISGCDSTIVTNLTVDSVAVKQGEVLPTHFISVWQNQTAITPMTIKVVAATKDDLPLALNDEIALYSGSLCVGSLKLTQPIDSANKSTFISIPASLNDGSGNGFTNNDTIIVKIWDDANHREMVVQRVKYHTDDASWLTTGRYSVNATSVIGFKSYTEYTQTISLAKGYNMMSTFVSADNPDVSAVTKQLTDAGTLVKVQDEYGNSYENWGSYGGWVNNLGNLKSTEGYKVKVDANCTLQVTGRSVVLPLDIPLNAGWNIISFPLKSTIDAMSIIQPLIDQNKLIKVQDEAGNSIEDWGAFGGWVNGIGNFTPGKAYKVKVNSNVTLTIK